MLHYDSKGRLTECELGGPDGESKSIAYNTDSHGNIIETAGIVLECEYKKIRVSEEQAQKLIAENSDQLYMTYCRNMLILYRIEE